jgi:hypothetical protein
MKQYILGNGGFAQEVYDLIFLQQHSEVEFGGYITLNENIPYIISKKGIKQFKYEDESSFVLGTGNKKWRKKFLDHFLYHYPKNKTHFLIYMPLILICLLLNKKVMATYTVLLP